MQSLNTCTEIYSRCSFLSKRTCKATNIIFAYSLNFDVCIPTKIRLFSFFCRPVAGAAALGPEARLPRGARCTRREPLAALPTASFFIFDFQSRVAFRSISRFVLVDLIAIWLNVAFVLRNRFEVDKRHRCC